MRRFAALSPVLALAACTMGPNYRAPEPAALSVPDTYYQREAGAVPAELSRWWQRFDDPLLTRLIDEASAGNLDLAAAAARLVQAREALVQARAGWSDGRRVGRRRRKWVGQRPTSFNPARRRLEIDLSAGSGAAWRPPGRTRKALLRPRGAARRARRESQKNRTGRLAQERLALARDNLAIADDNLQIARWRVEAGLVSSLDSEQARASRAQTAASIPALETAFASATYRLAVLTGRPPGALTRELTEARPIPRGPADVAVGIPADTLRQPPDIRVASARWRRRAVGVASLSSIRRASLREIGTSAFSGSLFNA